MKRIQLSIDFGSTNTAAAYSDETGAIRSIRLTSSSEVMPSAVFIDGSDVLVGQVALNNAAIAPHAFEPSPKRHLGEPGIVMAGVDWDPVDLAAAVLRRVLDEARRVAGDGIDDVTLTHPDAWGDTLQERLRTAAGRAGVHSSALHLVSEATAAAAFYSREPGYSGDSRICVVDFGAGTCDVAVLDRTSDGSYVVAAADGLVDLGGLDIDAAILSWVDRQSPTAALDVTSRLTLVDSARSAKEALSSASRAYVALPHNGRALQLPRTEFETLVSPLIERALQLTRHVVDLAHSVTPRHVSTVYLVGGSSHIPMVHTALRSVAPVATLGDPKTVVSHGALLIAQERAQACAGGTRSDVHPSDHNSAPPTEELSAPSPAHATGPRHWQWVGAGIVAATAATVGILSLVGGAPEQESRVTPTSTVPASVPTAERATTSPAVTQASGATVVTPEPGPETYGSNPYAVPPAITTYCNGADILRGRAC